MSDAPLPLTPATRSERNAPSREFMVQQATLCAFWQDSPKGMPGQLLSSWIAGRCNGGRYLPPNIVPIICREFSRIANGYEPAA